ncbi:MAG TPA: hypothetical protein VL970_00830, partial [Candidatus Acidoferrales bacterium]|nr:hypothetical protein [Candidatus Acidoferrales bacterium]
RPPSGTIPWTGREERGQRKRGFKGTPEWRLEHAEHELPGLIRTGGWRMTGNTKPCRLPHASPAAGVVAAGHGHHE